MSDLLLGVIIGGLVGLVGSVIQAHYSLKARREENLSRERQQATQIQHEKNRELIGRTIEVRRKYLEDLSQQLGKLQTCVEEFGDKFLRITVPHLPRLSGGSTSNATFEQVERLEKVDIDIDAINKRGLSQKIDTLQGEISSISAVRKAIYETFFKVTDIRLKQLIRDVVERSFDLQQNYLKFRLALAETENGHDFTCDVAPILKLVPEVNVSTGLAHKRIESLLAGVDQVTTSSLNHIQR
jgi:gas vesicle protein